MATWLLNNTYITELGQRLINGAVAAHHQVEITRVVASDLFYDELNPDDPSDYPPVGLTPYQVTKLRRERQLFSGVSANPTPNSRTSYTLQLILSNSLKETYLLKTADGEYNTQSYDLKQIGVYAREKRDPSLPQANECLMMFAECLRPDPKTGEVDSDRVPAYKDTPLEMVYAFMINTLQFDPTDPKINNLFVVEVTNDALVTVPQLERTLEEKYTNPVFAGTICTSPDSFITEAGGYLMNATGSILFFESGNSYTIPYATVEAGDMIYYGANTPYRFRAYIPWNDLYTIGALVYRLDGATEKVHIYHVESETDFAFDPTTATWKNYSATPGIQINSLTERLYLGLGWHTFEVYFEGGAGGGYITGQVRRGIYFNTTPYLVNTPAAKVVHEEYETIDPVVLDYYDLTTVNMKSTLLPNTGSIGDSEVIHLFEDDGEKLNIPANKYVYIDLGKWYNVTKLTVKESDSKGTLGVYFQDTDPTCLVSREYDKAKNPHGAYIVLKTDGEAQNGIVATKSEADTLTTVSIDDLTSHVGMVRYISLGSPTDDVSIDALEIEVYPYVVKTDLDVTLTSVDDELLSYLPLITGYDKFSPQAWLGDLSLLPTFDKSSIVNSMREFSQRLDNALTELGNALIVEITIPTTGWVSQPPDYMRNFYHIDLPVEKALYSMLPLVIIDRNSYEEAAKARIGTAAETSDGLIRLWARNIPENPINATVALFKHGVSAYLGYAIDANEGHNGGLESGNFVLQPATTKKLGGVIIGSNLDVEPDGTLSAGKVDPAYVATEEEVREMVREVLNNE